VYDIKEPAINVQQILILCPNPSSITSTYLFSNSSVKGVLPILNFMSPGLLGNFLNKTLPSDRQNHLI